MRNLKFYNKETNKFEEVPFIDRWEFDKPEIISKKLKILAQDRNVWELKCREFQDKLDELALSSKSEEKTAEFIAEIRAIPLEEAQAQIKEKVTEVEKKLGGPATIGMFLMELGRPEHGGFIQHNQSPIASLDLHFFLRTPINTIELTECNNYDGNKSGGCHNRDWGEMAHREQQATCMVDEESGEQFCDTVYNLAHEANKYPYKLMRGTTTSKEIFEFILGQEQMKEMLELYEQFIEKLE